METRDPGMRRLLAAADRAAATLANVLVTGEAGTGKNTLARRIHAASPRHDGPFVDVPCADLPTDLVESELFGHERGAFTGAVERRIGRFERAAGGTLLIDEPLELAPSVQAKVLRVVQERRFERVGGTETLGADVRVIATLREDPEAAVARGALRDDLYYRLNVVRLDLPPLRDRPGDVPLLAEAFLRDAIERHGIAARRLSPDVHERLRAHAWPGNLVELRHAVESAAVLCEDETIGIDALPPALSVAGAPSLRSSAASGRTLRDVEDAYIREVLARTRGNKSAAARILGIARKTLHERLRDPGDGDPS